MPKDSVAKPIGASAELDDAGRELLARLPTTMSLFQSARRMRFSDAAGKVWESKIVRKRQPSIVAT